MRMRRWLLSSTSGRITCFVLLGLFVVICGVHFADAHHDGDGDDLGFTNLLRQLGLLVLVGAFLLVAVPRHRLFVNTAVSWLQRLPVVHPPWRPRLRASEVRPLLC